jgi:hypothetical protein
MTGPAVEARVKTTERMTIPKIRQTDLCDFMLIPPFILRYKYPSLFQICSFLLNNASMGKVLKTVLKIIFSRIIV